MNEPIILGNFSNWLLVDLYFHLDRQDWEKTYVELIASHGERRRHLKFFGARNLQIADGFCGNLSGMCITDVASRQWGDVRVQIWNLEQGPGITLLALRMEIISDT